MPEHDRLNAFIAHILQVSLQAYSTDFDLAWELISDAAVVARPDGYYCMIEGVDWDGRVHKTMALAVCDAILRSRGLDIGVFE